MTKRRSFHVMASATLIFIAASMPIHAEGLGSLGTAVGCALGGVGNTVGGATGAVGNTVNGVTGTSTNTMANLGALDSNGALSLDANSQVQDGINAKARFLSPKQLARLCLATGGSKSGCGSGNRSQILGTVDANLNGLSDCQLAGLCVGVSAGCGGAAASTGGGAGGSGGGAAGGNGSQIVTNLSDRNVIAYKKRCVNILRSPQNYGDDMVSICRLIQHRKAS